MASATCSYRSCYCPDRLSTDQKQCCCTKGETLVAWTMAYEDGQLNGYAFIPIEFGIKVDILGRRH